MSCLRSNLIVPLLLALASPALAGLALPIATPVASARASAYFRADRIELRLNPPAAAVSRALQPLGARAGAPPLGALGVRSVDALAAQLGGVTFEPEFFGERPGSALSSFYIAHVPAGADLERTLDAFRALPDIASAAPIAVLPVSAMPNDSLFFESWWFYDAVGRHDIHAPEAWDITTGSATVPIAIIDTGVLSAHPDLGGVTAGSSGQIWTNAVEAAGVPGVDDDGNGYIDDIHGWDFVDLPVGSTVTLGEDAYDQDNDPSDYAGHGTAVAGLAAALTNNAIGVAGTAWHSPIMPIRAGWSAPGAVLGEVDMAFATRAIRYAMLMGARVINCSFETVNTPGLVAVTDSAVAAGVLICVAAGNNNPLQHDLADREDVLAVGSTGPTDEVATDSNRGDFVDLCAPGYGVSSTFLLRGAGGGPAEPSYLIYASGTSLASPIAAGAAALVISDREAKGVLPLSPMDLLLRLRDSATDITAENPGLDGYGDGRLNAEAALTQTRVSYARHAGAGTVGAPVVLDATGNSKVIVWATADSALVYMSSLGDTLRRVALGAGVVGSPASANLADGMGPGVFVALDDGHVDGFDGYGDALPGWPVAVAAPADPPGSGVSVGDIDDIAGNDIEIVCVTLTGNVYVWKVDGSLLPGYPAASGGQPAIAAPVLAPLDNVAGAEIVFTNLAGRVYAFRNDALVPRLPGWPKLVGGARSPVVVWAGVGPQPRVIVPFGNSLRAYDAAGVVLYTMPLGGTVAGDPIAADLRGIGRDDIIVPLHTPDALAAFDADGQPLQGWPIGLASAVVGAPIARTGPQLDASLTVVLLPTDRLRAYTYAGNRLTDYPKPGLPGPSVTIAKIDEMLGERVLTSPGFDSTFYFYMPPTQALVGGWTTDRANFARTGSNLVIPPPGLVNNVPAGVTDLQVVGVGDTSLTLTWTATGDDSLRGRPLEYDLRAAESPIGTSAQFFLAPIHHVVAATVDAGGHEETNFTGLATGHTYWFALRARDRQGETSRLSNSPSGTTDVGGPLASVRGVGVRSLAQPSRAPVSFVWRGISFATGQTLSVYDVSGRLRRRFDLGSAPSGTLVWDGTDRSGAPAESGIYFVRIATRGTHAGTRLVLIR